MFCKIKIDLDYLHYCFECDGIIHSFTESNFHLGKLTSVSYSEKSLTSELLIMTNEVSSMKFYEITEEIGNHDSITLYG